MFATSEGATRYTDRFPEYRDAAFYHVVENLGVARVAPAAREAYVRLYQ